MSISHRDHIVVTLISHHRYHIGIASVWQRTHIDITSVSHRYRIGITSVSHQYHISITSERRRRIFFYMGRPPARAGGGAGAEKSLADPSHSGIIAHSFARTHDTFTKTKPKSISRLGSQRTHPPNLRYIYIYIYIYGILLTRF